ncbi:hypothetical protein CBP36_20005 (plasmid) [Acidovorax carolinensis]|uniref:AAA+ ATPase domain-containing protein n=2 Tax=Acidovorax carolinensis TaxID=553814 RepID=A0A240UJK2_9BURK|nr:hypothetical protein CBP36_20005 [Acidovorax carolinensis]
MKFLIGSDAALAAKGQVAEVFWDTHRLVNGHTLLLGMSGAGKTHTLKRMISALQKQSPNTRFHVFDVHGDISIEGASEVLYSANTPYGLQPLRVNPDLHYGGVLRCIENFTEIVGQTIGKLGARQEAVLRKILLDVYRLHGFVQEDPSTWFIDGEAHLISDGSDNRLYLDVPRAEKDSAKAFGARWDPSKSLWWIQTDQYEGGITRWAPKRSGRTFPSIDDVINYANRLIKMSFLGADQEAVTQLEIFNKAAMAMHRRMIREHREGQVGPSLVEEESEALDKARAKAIDAYTTAVEKIRTGTEMEDLIKYDSQETLKSVLDRLETLRSYGIFKNQPPPFDPHARVWVHKLKPLKVAVANMFVLFSLQEMYDTARERGEQGEVLDILVLDEVHRYADNEEGILCTLSRESRKFGVAIIAANQDADLPPSFISSLATKMVLGIDELYWRSAETRMNIERRLLEWIKPQRTMAVQMKEIRATKSSWKWVVLQ